MRDVLLLIGFLALAFAGFPMMARLDRCLEKYLRRPDEDAEPGHEYPDIILLHDKKRQK